MRSQFSSGVSGQIAPENSIQMPQATTGRCAQISLGRQATSQPPSTTKITNNRCRISTVSASARQIMRAPYAANGSGLEDERHPQAHPVTRDLVVLDRDFLVGRSEERR